MALLNSYLKKQAEMERLKAELEALEGDERLQHDMEFQSKLHALMEEYGKSKSDVIKLLYPSRMMDDSNKATQGRKKRKLKRYTHPYTGEVVETRGGNHKKLKSWKGEHGDATVESWCVVVD